MNENKEVFEAPTIEIIEIENSDIITASCNVATLDPNETEMSPYIGG